MKTKYSYTFIVSGVQYEMVGDTISGCIQKTIDFIQHKESPFRTEFECFVIGGDNLGILKKWTQSDNEEKIYICKKICDISVVEFSGLIFSEAIRKEEYQYYKTLLEKAIGNLQRLPSPQLGMIEF